MGNHEFSVRIRAGNGGIAEELERIVLSTKGLRLHTQVDKGRPDLLIFELGEKYDEEFKLIQSLLTSGTVGEVHVTSRRKDADMLLKTMKTGIKEFLSQPLVEEEVKEALDSFKKRIEQSVTKEVARFGQIIDVMGSKGGVGTTTVAVNLAMILAGKKQAGSVALVDMNTVFGDVPLFLSVKPDYHWGEISKNVNRLDSTFLMNVLARHPSGLHILPSPGYLNGHPPATPQIMERVLTLMKRTFDFVVVDGGQSLDGPSQKVIQMSDKIFLITLLNLPCLSNTNKLLRSLATVGVMTKDQVRIVINRYLKKSDISIKEAEESVRSRIFWNIPNDYKTTMSAINQGKALYDIAPKAAITKNLVTLADSLIQGEPKEEKKGWSFFKK
jgi:pilus assembly protein CpaE